MQWVQRFATVEPVTVLDIGGRDINGSPRALFPNADYVVLDVRDEPGVDIVADAATWIPDRAYDVVVCTEVFEHTPVWRGIARTAHAALKPGGLLVTTMAGPGRAPHSAHDGGTLRQGEYYGNVDPLDLDKTLNGVGFMEVDIDCVGTDVRASARRA